MRCSPSTAALTEREAFHALQAGNARLVAVPEWRHRVARTYGSGVKTRAARTRSGASARSLAPLPVDGREGGTVSKAVPGPPGTSRADRASMSGPYVGPSHADIATAGVTPMGGKSRSAADPLAATVARAQVGRATLPP